MLTVTFLQTFLNFPQNFQKKCWRKSVINRTLIGLSDQSSELRVARPETGGEESPHSALLWEAWLVSALAVSSQATGRWCQRLEMPLTVLDWETPHLDVLWVWGLMCSEFLHVWALNYLMEQGWWAVKVQMLVEWGLLNFTHTVSHGPEPGCFLTQFPVNQSLSSDLLIDLRTVFMPRIEFLTCSTYRKTWRPLKMLAFCKLRKSFKGICCIPVSMSSSI